MYGLHEGVNNIQGLSSVHTSLRVNKLEALSDKNGLGEGLYWLTQGHKSLGQSIPCLRLSKLRQ